MTGHRARMIALLVAWATLITANLLTARAVSDLITVVEAEVQATSQQVCGAWLGTYQFLNIWAGENLSPSGAKWARERFAADFKASCGDYRQTFPSKP